MSETDITIPRDALEAAKNAWYANQHKGTDERMSVACLAMLNAWPGMGTVATEDHAGVWRQIILPLTQESGNE